MSAGKSNLASLVFLDQTARIWAWPTLLSQAKIVESTVHHYLKNVTPFLDYIAETAAVEESPGGDPTEGEVADTLPETEGGGA